MHYNYTSTCDRENPSSVSILRIDPTSFYSKDDLVTFDSKFKLGSPIVSSDVNSTFDNPNQCAVSPSDCINLNTITQYLSGMSKYCNIELSDTFPQNSKLNMASHSPVEAFAEAATMQLDRERVTEPQVVVVPYIISEVIQTEAVKDEIANMIQDLTARGFTLIVSAGDDGAIGGSNGNCSYFDSTLLASPYAIVVGSTSWNAVTYPSQLSQEVVGMCGNIGEYSGTSSGGGFSRYYNDPSQIEWQREFKDTYFERASHAIPHAGSYNASGRGYPDISLFGDLYSIVMNDKTTFVGGTGASAAVFGGILGTLHILNQREGNVPIPAWLNPTLYAIANRTDDVFNDIVLGINRCAMLTSDAKCPSCTCSEGLAGWYSMKGWDPASGFGSINVGRLFEELNVTDYRYKHPTSPLVTATQFAMLMMIILVFIFIVLALVLNFPNICGDNEEDDEAVVMGNRNDIYTPLNDAESATGDAGDAEISEANPHIRKYANGERPFFLAFGAHRPHLPWNVPTKFWDMYGPTENVSLPTHQSAPQDMPPIAFTYECDGKTEVIALTETAPIPYPNVSTALPSNMTKTLRRGYYSSVSWTDYLIGELMTALDESGVANKTLIVLLGDHGWQLGEHNIWGKHTNFELGTRVPLIIVDPEIDSFVSDALVESVDVYPTVAALAGIPNPPDLDGVDLTPLMEKTRPELKDAVFSEYPRCPSNISTPWDDTTSCVQTARENFTAMGYSVRTQDWRYTVWLHWDGNNLKGDFDRPPIGVELYAHDGDSGANFNTFENTNLAEDPAHEDVRNRLHAVAFSHWNSGGGLTTPPIEHRGFKNFKIGEAYGDQYSNPAEPPDFVDQLSKENTKLKPPGLPITPPPPPLEMPHPPPPSYGVGGSLGFMGDIFESSFTEDGSLGHIFPYFVTSEMALNKEGLRQVFDRIDKNGDGVLEHDELCKGFEERGIVFTSDTIRALIDVADTNRDGVIQYEEFEAMMEDLWKKHKINPLNVGSW
eukprot:g1200.t1